MKINSEDVVNKVALECALLVKLMEDGKIEEASDLADKIARFIWKYEGIVKSLEVDKVL